MHYGEPFVGRGELVEPWLLFDVDGYLSVTSGVCSRQLSQKRVVDCTRTWKLPAETRSSSPQAVTEQ